MAKHCVKCLYCGVVFDTNAEPFVKPAERRYAHATCAEKYQQSQSSDEKDYAMLISYCKNVLGMPQNALLNKQITSFKKEYGYTCKDILRTVKWWKEIQKKPFEENYGIAIVPYVYEECKRYYLNLQKIMNLNDNITVQLPERKVKEIIIDTPVGAEKKCYLFNLEDN